MKKLAKTLSIFALAFFPLINMPYLQASGEEVLRPEIELVTQQNMIRRGNSLVMDLMLPQSGMTTLAVVGADGREVWSADLNFEAGQNRVKFRVGDLQPGTYFLKVQSNGYTDAQTFAVR